MLETETTIEITLTVNGQPYTRRVEPRMLLSDFLRHTLGLTGTHVGCEHGVCGACTILVDGSSVRARWAPNAKYIVTYAGAMGMANDLSTLLQAAAQLRAFPEIQFWLVGDGKDRTQLEALARELELTNVRFTGTIPKNELSAVFGASDACLATLKDIPMFRTTYPTRSSTTWRQASQPCWQLMVSYAV